MITETIRLFNAVRVSPKQTDKLFRECNEVSLKYGYLVHPDACSKELINWFNKTSVDNYNSTFYYEWNDITSKDRFELAIDQVIHYMSTYGTEFQDVPYVVNETPMTIELTRYKVINALTKDELIDRCMSMLSSGAPLAQDTINDIFVILTDLDYTKQIDVDVIKNKEAQMRVYKITNTLPKDPVEMVRYLVFLATDNALLIKDKSTIETIKGKSIEVSDIIDQFGADKLSSVFFRFKAIFLAFKKNTKKNSKSINKLRKLAETNHKPMTVGFFENILSDRKDLGDVSNRLTTLNNFKKIQLLQSILVRLKKLDTKVYIIRNGRVFIKTGEVNVDTRYLANLYNTIYDSVVSSIRNKACTIQYPENINITAPTSVKNFIGNFPIGSYINFRDTDNIIGIHWRGDNGARDIDLSLVSITGDRLGWNAEYYNKNNSLIYSGDMTSANPEATELFYASGNFQPCIVKINPYRINPNSKFKFFIAQEKIVDMRRGYMVDPNNIVFSTDAELNDELMMGLVTKDRFIFTQLKTGKGRVSYFNDWTKKHIQYILDTSDCYIDLKGILKDAGFTFVKEDAKIDLTNLSKDTILSLFS